MPEPKVACQRGCEHDARDCPVHGAKVRQRERAKRSSAPYGHRWKTFRASVIRQMFASEVPRAGLCGCRPIGTPDTNDSRCARLGLITRGSVLDHVQPIRNEHDPRMFDLSNLQLLCDRCHNAKRQKERA